MPATLEANFTFSPQIAQSHISAYFRTLLLITRLGYMPDPNKFPTTPGGDLTFPVFGQIGEAEDGVENTDVSIDSLGDSSFTAAIKEITKGVGITDTAMKKMGCTHEQWEREAHLQIARVLAEKLEKDVWEKLNESANHDDLTSNSADITLTSQFGPDKGANSDAMLSQLCNIRAISEALQEAFGDRRGECAAVILHSSHYKDIEQDATAGFLKADANDPFKLAAKGAYVGKAPGFFNIPFFQIDSVPAGDDITISDSGSGTQKYKTYNMVMLKKNAFGVFMKQFPRIEYDRNIRMRQDFMVATQWYALRGFHKAISTDDVRVAYKRFTTKIQSSG